MEIIFSIVGKIGEYSVGPIGEQFGYIISYKNNIATLEEKILKLLEKNEAVQQSVDGAQWNQQVVASEVKTWLTNVRKKIEEAQKFLEEDVKANRMCLNGWCLDLKLRYSLGNKAQKNTQAIIQLLEEGGKYDKVYNIAPPLEVRSSSTGWFKDFESRKSMIQNVLDALKNDKIDMVALCGMGGIGKTEMAKEIERRVKSDNLFRKVVFAVVSRSPSMTKIQGELAEMLGPRLDAESLHGRAHELYSRLTKNKNVLVILDDVWGQFDLGAIGVIDAIKQKSCKILLTSRNEETCNGMSIQPKIFPVGLLSKEEAWNLFKEMAGDCINASDLISIAKQVAKECACLPIAIATVGGALSNKSDKNEWKAALQQLKMSIPQNIFGLHQKVYSSIEFSYNYLESDEAKSCFLLCCLYPEDYNVPVEHLVRYGVAKRFLKGLGNVEQTRVHVHTIVRNLRRSNLLLDSDQVECVKMHDVVRDVAISIASKDENGFMVVLDKGLEEWPQKDRCDSYTAISLSIGEMKGHPTELKYPKLQLLQLYLNRSETFLENLFNGMKELKILSLHFSLKTLPQSIENLQNLQMLNLENCRLRDVSAIGTLGNLEILGFPNSVIEELPSEIGNLSRLKLLDMKGCYSLKRIAAGVLSGLSRLEELYMGGFKNWGCTTTMEGNGKVTNNNASLAELIRYSSQLVVLEISVPSILCLPKELDFNNSNFRFMIDSMIDIGIHTKRPYEGYLFENTLRLEVEDASDLGEYRIIRSLLKNVVVLELKIAKNSKHIWFQKEEDGVLPCSLKDLMITRCEDLEYLLKATSDSIPPNTFHLLESLSLKDLPRLIGIDNSTDSVEVEGGGSIASTTVSHKLFSSNTILWVPNLELLQVEHCGSLKVVFDLEGLKVKENCKPILSVLSKLELRGLFGMSHVWKNIPPGFQGFQNLIFIHIEECRRLRDLLPASIAKLLVQLQKVEIRDCHFMENIIQREYEAGEERREDILSSETHSLKWPSIKIIKLWSCPRLKTFGSEVQSGRKQRKMDAELDPIAQEPSAASSSARESSGLFNRCLESCVPCRRNYSPGLQAQGKSCSSLGENKHDLIDKEITLTKQEEQNVRETENQAKMCLFPYNLIEILENLEQLSIDQCHSLEVIFELEGLNVEESNIFNNLTELSLKYLSKLLHIWKKGPQDIKGFNYLRLLLVWGCDSLKCLFTPSIAKLLVKVEEIEVYSCNEMEEILAKELGDEENRDVIAFPLVKTLKLENLQKLECFYTEDNHAFEWPSLDKITIVGCPELKMFVWTSTKTPKLMGVHTYKTFQPMVEGDLNATIQRIIKGKGLNEFSTPPNFFTPWFFRADDEDIFDF